jgi:serine/threonine protein kinase
VLLGEGATGAVYEATSERGEALAIKFLHDTFADDAEMVARFRREANICQRLRSDHIAQVVGAGRAGDTHWIAYRRLRGETLAARLLKEGVLTPAAVGQTLEEVLLGLSVAHAAGIVHRDVKPANVMLELTRRGERVCILDFGVSKDRSSSRGSTAGSTSHGLTSATATLGTINYMPPEQVGGAAGVDHRADLYAVGVVAYRAITGQLPYVGKLQAAVLHAKLHRDARSLREATSLVWPEPLETFFGLALARDPGARFQDASSMSGAWIDATRSPRVPEISELRRRSADSDERDDTVLDPLDSR